MTERNGRETIRKMTIKDSNCSELATLSRWSSEPASLSSSADETIGIDLLERTRRSIATIQRALAAEREHSRRLQLQLESERSQNTLTPTTFDAVLRCIEQERSENRKLHNTVQRQHKTIVKLRRQLRALRLRPTIDGSSISSENLDDRDDSLSDSDFEMVPAQSDCSRCIADDCRRMVHI